MTIRFVKPDWPAKKNVRAFTTEIGDYSENNFSFHLGINKEKNILNRKRLVQEFDLPNEPIWLNQIHSSLVIDIDKSIIKKLEGDGIFTKKKKNALAILSADCLPILISSTMEDKICALHGGWRGLSSGIIQNAIKLMDCNPGELIVWLGPGISQAAYEVGDKVYEAFQGFDIVADSQFKKNSKNSWNLDLYGLARLIFNHCGIYSIYGGNFCTFNEKSRFFSHRRDSKSGRMATILWLD
tara:strand:+ start:50270 stop:50989 length:720 start_codon:yes stop_codon:yes gene_type:complete